MIQVMPLTVCGGPSTVMGVPSIHGRILSFMFGVRRMYTPSRPVFPTFITVCTVRIAVGDGAAGAEAVDGVDVGPAERAGRGCAVPNSPGDVGLGRAVTVGRTGVGVASPEGAVRVCTAVTAPNTRMSRTRTNGMALTPVSASAYY